MTCALGGFGTMGLGSGPFGSGGSFAIASAVADSTRSVVVTFVTPPAASDPATFWDALRVANWSLNALIPNTAAVRLPQYVERVSSTQVRVFFDGELDPFALYRIVASPFLRSASGAAIVGTCRTFEFYGLDRYVAERGAQPGREIASDIANPWSAFDAARDPDAALGTFQIDSDGDYSLDEGRIYLRKRVIRRATTSVGGFFHLPTYGFGFDQKGLITPDLLRRTQSLATSQILQEPGVLSARVTATQDPTDPSVVVLDIRIRDTNGNSDQMSVPVVLFQ